MNSQEYEQLFKTYDDLRNKLCQYDALTRDIKDLTKILNALNTNKEQNIGEKLLMNDEWYFLNYIKFDDIKYLLIEKTKEELNKKNKELMSL